MKKATMTICLACVMAVANFASAEIIRGIDIDFVTIGNPGNTGDTRDEARPMGCGKVDYVYQIGKYEITNYQWNIFTAVSGLPNGYPVHAYDQTASYTDDFQPTSKVSWHEAAQFCNYLTSGDKSLGAYLFSGNNTNPGDFLGIERESAISAYGTIYVIPTEDEWYKAAYYKQDGTGYSLYANGTDLPPIPDVDTNYKSDIVGGSPWNVGSGTIEQNGTFDMMGNLWEWNQKQIGWSLGLRGGYHDSNTQEYHISSSCQYLYDPFTEYSSIGFRVVSITNPIIPTDPYCGDKNHPFPPMDFTEDCRVDLADFAMFAIHWLDCTAPECD